MAATVWGIGDFSGGMGVKTAGGTVGAALRVVLLSHATSFSFLLAAAWALGDAFPHGRALACALAAGVAAGFALSAFYIALARGAMGVSAAISGVLAAAIPAVVSMFADGEPGWRHGGGFLVAGLAIWLIAAGDAEREQRSTTALAIGAGIGFGLYFVALKYAGTAGVIWPLATVRTASMTTCGLILLALQGRGVAGVPVAITRHVMFWVVSTALFDTTGNLLFIAATRAGRLDVAAVLASLYPASTILMAAWRMKERPTRRQAWGMAVAGIAVVLVAG
jgi:uncharacterized membrane protein